MAPADYYVIAIDKLEPGQWTDPEFLERVGSKATGISVRDGEIGTVDLVTWRPKVIAPPIQDVRRRERLRRRAIGERLDHHDIADGVSVDDCHLRRQEAGRQPAADRRAPLGRIARDQHLKDRADPRARRIAIARLFERPLGPAHADHDIGGR